MASIIRRVGADGRETWQGRVRLKGQHASETFDRKTDAKAWAVKVEREIETGLYQDQAEARRHNVVAMLDRYEKHVLPHKRQGTSRKQRQQLAWWKAQIGKMALADLRPALIAETRDKLTSDGAGPATANRYLAVLSHACSVAAREWGWLQANPVRDVKKLREPRGRVRYLDDSEREALLKACQASSCQDLRPAVVVALATGMRQQELLGLRWSQVNLRRGLVSLPDSKSGKPRAVPLTGLALELLRERDKARTVLPLDKRAALVFPASYDAARPADLRVPWAAALKEAGISDFRWHDLRHSCASYLAMNGASAAEIAEVLGHKTLQMVQRYSHLSQAHTARVVESMTARMFAGEKLTS